MSKTFAAAGVSKQDGKFSFRATNREGDTYSEILKKEGHTDVHIVKLKSPMSKEEAKKYCAGLKHFQEPTILKCLKDEDKPAGKKKEAKAPAKKAAAKKATKAKGGGSKKKDNTAGDGSEVSTVEGSEDGESTDIAQELGVPAFSRHTQEA